VILHHPLPSLLNVLNRTDKSSESYPHQVPSHEILDSSDQLNEPAEPFQLDIPEPSFLYLSSHLVLDFHPLQEFSLDLGYHRKPHENLGFTKQNKLFAKIRKEIFDHLMDKLFKVRFFGRKSWVTLI
jgi:hypothetical protein